MNRIPGFIMGTAAIFALFLSVAATNSSKYKGIAFADAHLHLLDFLQNGDYLEQGKVVEKAASMTLPFGEMGKRIEAALWAMDEANVSHALVSGMPFVKKWSENEKERPAYYLDSSSPVLRARDTDYVVALSLPDYKKKHGEKNLERLFPCVSGFDATDLGAVDMIAKRIKEFPGVFSCIGEVMSRHDDLTNLTPGEKPRGNHPALFRVFDFAGKFKIPVSIHHNIGEVSPSGEAKPPMYLDEMTTSFDEFPETTFIWCHAGISRRIVIEDLPAVLDDMLKTRKKHVYLDISWVVFEEYILKDPAAWAKLIKKYPENFMIGSDSVGKYDNYRQEIHKYEQLFEHIDDKKVIENLVQKNLLRIMPKEKIRLPRSYKYPENRYTTRGLPVKGSE